MADNTNPLESGNWNEPKTSYGKVKGKTIKGKKGKVSTLYPFNKVYESESGHVLEIDDTPGSERLHLFHRSGTFQEIHPNGDSVTKVVRDNYTSILRDNYVHIDGHCNVTIDKALKILVNSDKKQNTPNKTTNFDIEIGDNANINILVNKGNCQVRLKDGDANVLIDRGDVNIRQSAGNYNHFVNGDYNLEVTGHKHVVVGGDSVTEIKGCRDIRIDGEFDNLFISRGYKETQVPFGNLQTIIGLNKEEIIGKECNTQIGANRVTVISGVDETSITGIYSLRASSISNIGYSGGVSFGNSFSGFDIDAQGNLSCTSGQSINFNAPSIFLTSVGGEGIQLLSNTGPINLTGLNIDLYGLTNINLQSQISTNLFSDGNILQTAQQIHLNGPPALRAITANSGIMGQTLNRLQPPTPPSRPFFYTPGVVKQWIKTTNGITPTNLIKNSINTLKTQLAALDDAANTTAGIKQQTNGLYNSVLQIESNSVSGLSTGGVNDIGGQLTSATTQASVIGNNALGVSNNLTSVTDTVSSTVQGVTDTVSSVSSSNLTDGLTNITSDGGPLSTIKGAISSVTGFVGDILGTIADIACTIVDAIGSIIDALTKTITDAIKSVLNAINSVVDAIASIIQTIQKLISDAIKQITDLIGSILDAAGDFIDGIIDSIAGIFDGIGGRPIDCGKSLNAAQENSNINTYNEALANGEITEEEYERLVYGNG
jgi:hypothetical protein